MRMVQKCIQTGGLAETGLLNAAYGGKTLNVSLTAGQSPGIKQAGFIKLIFIPVYCNYYAMLQAGPNNQTGARIG